MRINFVSPTFLSNQNLKKSNAKNPKVSVILPIYNQEKYLSTALKSIQAQTLSDIEVICVNDGSKDNSLEILNEYAQKDSRIKILNQKNQGSGPARNNGLKIATGDYVAFVDPDDWLEPEAFELLYNKSRTQKCDMVVFNFKKVAEDGKTIGQFDLKKRLEGVHPISEHETFNWKNIKQKVFGGIYPTVWNKFYDREFVKKSGLHFANCSLAEDGVFIFGATLNAKNIGFLDKSLYNYLIHENSAIRSRSDKHLCLFKSLDSVKKLLKNLGLQDELKNEFDKYILRIVSFHSKQIKSVEKFKEICKKRLTPIQNQMLNDRELANAKIMPIIKSLLNSKK